MAVPTHQQFCKLLDQVSKNAMERQLQICMDILNKGDVFSQIDEKLRSAYAAKTIPDPSLIRVEIDDTRLGGEITSGFLNLIRARYPGFIIDIGNCTIHRFSVLFYLNRVSSNDNLR
jgi:hypothetical protein